MGMPNSSYDYQRASEPHGAQPGKVTRSSGGHKAESEGRTAAVASRGAYHFTDESSSLIREEGDNSSRAAITNNSESKEVSKDQAGHGEARDASDDHVEMIFDEQQMVQFLKN